MEKLISKLIGSELDKVDCAKLKIQEEPRCPAAGNFLFTKPTSFNELAESYGNISMSLIAVEIFKNILAKLFRKLLLITF